MKILLMGPSGQLGSDIQKLYSQRYHAHHELVLCKRDQLDISNIHFIEDFLKTQNYDVLINCTSYHKTDEVEKHANLAFTINAHAVAKLAQVCSKKNAIFIHISTDYVFSGSNSSLFPLPSSPRTPYTENSPTGPLNVYGASKLMGENLALYYCEKTYLLRVASLFGFAGASGKGGNFVETMIKIGKEKGVLNVVNDITMSPTSTAWVAEAIFKLIEHKADYGIYHTVNSGQATWHEFAKQIIHKAKINAELLPVTSAEFPTLALRPSYSVLDNSKLKNVIGVIPHWESMLDLYLKEKGYS